MSNTRIILEKKTNYRQVNSNFYKYYVQATININ